MDSTGSLAELAAEWFQNIGFQAFGAPRLKSFGTMSSAVGGMAAKGVEELRLIV